MFSALCKVAKTHPFILMLAASVCRNVGLLSIFELAYPPSTAEVVHRKQKYKYCFCFQLFVIYFLSYRPLFRIFFCYSSYVDPPSFEIPVLNRANPIYLISQQNTLDLSSLTSANKFVKGPTLTYSVKKVSFKK